MKETVLCNYVIREHCNVHWAGHERRSTAWRCHRFKFSEKKNPRRSPSVLLHRLSNILYILLCPSVTLLLIIVNNGIIMRHLTPPGQYLTRLKLPVGLHNIHKGNCVNDDVCKSVHLRTCCSCLSFSNFALSHFCGRREVSCFNDAQLW